MRPTDLIRVAAQACDDHGVSPLSVDVSAPGYVAVLVPDLATLTRIWCGIGAIEESPQPEGSAYSWVDPLGVVWVAVSPGLRHEVEADLARPLDGAQ